MTNAQSSSAMSPVLSPISPLIGKLGGKLVGKPGGSRGTRFRSSRSFEAPVYSDRDPFKKMFVSQKRFSKLEKIFFFVSISLTLVTYFRALAL